MNRRDAFKALLGLPAGSAIDRLPAQSLKPTDIFVITVPQEITLEQAERIQRQMKKLWPDHKAIVLGAGAKLTIV
jgi:hypothetical protein